MFFFEKMNLDESNNVMNEVIELLNSGNVVRGMALLNQMILLDPTDAEKVHFRGEMYLKLGNPELASIDFLKAINLSNNVFQYHYNLGCAYIDIKQYENALNSFNNAAEINLYDSDIYTNRGLCYTHLGYPIMAIFDFKRALEINPNNNMAVKLVSLVNNFSKESKDFLDSQFKIKEKLHEELDAVFYMAVQKRVLSDDELMPFFAYYTVDFINENINSQRKLNEESLSAMLNFTYDFIRGTFKEGFLDSHQIRKVKKVFNELIKSPPDVSAHLREELIRKIYEAN